MLHVVLTSGYLLYLLDVTHVINYKQNCGLISITGNIYLASASDLLQLRIVYLASKNSPNERSKSRINMTR